MTGERCQRSIALGSACVCLIVLKLILRAGLVLCWRLKKTPTLCHLNELQAMHNQIAEIKAQRLPRWWLEVCTSMYTEPLVKDEHQRDDNDGKWLKELSLQISAGFSAQKAWISMVSNSKEWKPDLCSSFKRVNKQTATKKTTQTKHHPANPGREDPGRPQALASQWTSGRTQPAERRI